MENAVVVETLKGFSGNTRIKKKFMKIWDDIGNRVYTLPKEQQNILLEDFLTAIQSRLLIMERINKGN